MVTSSQALWLDARGLSIIPIPLPIPGTPPNTVGDGKTPAVAWKRYQGERPTEAQIRQWFRAPQNVAIITGAVSGVVAVDPDSNDALLWATRHLPYTPWQTKTARGFHLFYRHPGVPVRNKACIETGDGKIALDVRGDGGFVIGPGSLHASGATYTMAGDWREPVTALPTFDPAWLQPVVTQRMPSERTATRDTTKAPVHERARRYLASIPVPEIGQGSDNQTLYAAAKLVRGFALPDADAIDLLDARFGGRPGWDRAWIASKVANAHRFGTEPIGNLL